MNVKKLREELAQYPDDMAIIVSTRLNDFAGVISEEIEVKKEAYCKALILVAKGKEVGEEK